MANEPAPDLVTLEVGDHRAVVDLGAGGRLASLCIGGLEVLVTEPRTDPMGWGSYPMVPWAGRVRHGRFRWEGDEYRLPVTLGPHAIHGVGYLSRWQLDHAGPTSARIRTALDDPWPFGGEAVATFDLFADRLECGLTVVADHAMPAMVGWHPWFRRRLERGGPVELSFVAGAMYELDDEAIPTGRLVSPPPGPWDNCFTDLAADPRLHWPDALTITLSSTTDEWVVYTEPDHAVCVEPQTGAPDAFNRPAPPTASPGQPLTAHCTMTWTLAAPP